MYTKAQKSVFGPATLAELVGTYKKKPKKSVYNIEKDNDNDTLCTLPANDFYV